MVAQESERNGSEIRTQCSPPELGVSTFLVLKSGVAPSQPKTPSPLERITCLDILTFVYIQIRISLSSLVVLFPAKCSCGDEPQRDHLESETRRRRIHGPQNIGCIFF